MKEATLQISEEEQKRLAFAAMIASNAGFLPKEVVDKFSRGEFRGEIADRLLYAFTHDGSPALIVPSSGFKIEETNLVTAIAVTEHFTKKVLGVTVDLRKQFDLPTTLPWKDVLLVFDPGLNNRQAVEKAIHGQNINKSYEEVNIMEYSGSEASSQPTLRIIENSLRPTEDTLGTMAKSPDQLSVDGRLYLDLRGYALASGLRYFTSKDYLDPKTWTWFPKNRLSGGKVARGDWDPLVDYRQFKFCWYGSGFVVPRCGARLAILVPLKP